MIINNKLQEIDINDRLYYKALMLTKKLDMKQCMV